MKPKLHNSILVILLLLAGGVASPFAAGAAPIQL
jgi:hypothetical protein